MHIDTGARNQVASIMAVVTGERDGSSTVIRSTLRRCNDVMTSPSGMIQVNFKCSALHHDTWD